MFWKFSVNFRNILPRFWALFDKLFRMKIPKTARKNIYYFSKSKKSQNLFKKGFRRQF